MQLAGPVEHQRLHRLARTCPEARREHSPREAIESTFRYADTIRWIEGNRLQSVTDGNWPLYKAFPTAYKRSKDNLQRLRIAKDVGTSD